MGAIASQITSLTIVYSTVYSDADQRKHQSSASLALVRGIHRSPVNSPHKWPVTRKTFPFDDVIMGLRSPCITWTTGTLSLAWINFNPYMAQHISVSKLRHHWSKWRFVAKTLPEPINQQEPAWRKVKLHYRKYFQVDAFRISSAKCRKDLNQTTKRLTRKCIRNFASKMSDISFRPCCVKI